METRRRAPAQSALPADPKPSEVTDSYWLSAERRTGSYPAATENCGKWLVFFHVSQIDAIWEKIKLATEEGKLGSSAKVATARPNPNARDPNRKVICVYTYDWTDETDVKRIRAELRSLGVTSRIPYKADRDTYEGKYANRGHTRFSKYYE
jgi:hypothetical protein